MSEVTVGFLVRTAKAVYSEDEARQELANLQAALKDIEWKQGLIDKAREETTDE